MPQGPSSGQVRCSVDLGSGLCSLVLGLVLLSWCWFGVGLGFGVFGFVSFVLLVGWCMAGRSAVGLLVLLWSSLVVGLAGQVG